MKPDYTDRVVRHRHELGHRMLEERQQNKYADIRYDKLIVNHQVYKYDYVNSPIVCIGRRQVTRQSRDNARGQPVNMLIEKQFPDWTYSSTWVVTTQQWMARKQVIGPRTTEGAVKTRD